MPEKIQSPEIASAKTLWLYPDSFHKLEANPKLMAEFVAFDAHFADVKLAGPHTWAELTFPRNVVAKSILSARNVDRMRKIVQTAINANTDRNPLAEDGWAQDLAYDLRRGEWSLPEPAPLVGLLPASDPTTIYERAMALYPATWAGNLTVEEGAHGEAIMSRRATLLADALLNPDFAKVDRKIIEVLYRTGHTPGVDPLGFEGKTFEEFCAIYTGVNTGDQGPSGDTKAKAKA